MLDLLGGSRDERAQTLEGFATPWVRRNHDENSTMVPDRSVSALVASVAVLDSGVIEVACVKNIGKEGYPRYYGGSLRKATLIIHPGSSHLADVACLPVPTIHSGFVACVSSATSYRLSAPPLPPDLLTTRPSNNSHGARGLLASLSRQALRTDHMNQQVGVGARFLTLRRPITDRVQQPLPEHQQRYRKNNPWGKNE